MGVDGLRRKWLFLIGLIAVVLLADQITKRLVVDNIRVGESRQPIPALSQFFQITRSQNTGAAFGFLPQAGDLFLVIATVVVIAMFYFYPRIPDGVWLTRLATGLICGGALGNALDRLEYGHVVDFIHYQIPGLISNVSNLADHAIVFGVILIFVQSWRSERAAKQAALTSEVPEPPGTNVPS
jgi:signal peptidase II